MRKEDMIETYAEHFGITKKQAKTEIERFVEFVKYQVECGGEVGISGFGTFGSKARKPRTVLSPMTGSAIEVPEKRVAYFKMSPKFRQIFSVE